MSAYDLQIPKTKFSLIEWRNPSNEKPKENDRCLIIIGSDVLAARFTHGEFYANNWTRAKSVSAWSPWPQAPVA
jgi:hypothetical protein